MQDSDRPNPDQSLAQLWAQKYVENLSDEAIARESSSVSSRATTTEKVLDMLRFCSSRAWGKTEELLLQTIPKQRINADFIDPWKIAEDSRQLFEIACDAYQKHLTPEQFSFVVARSCGQVRQHHTAQDPRLLGFLSMQFYYTGQFLLRELTPLEQHLWTDYIKVMDDHLYMPLHRAYEAAANQPHGSPALVAVQQLLSISTHVAEYICAQVAEQNVNYCSYSGSLSNLNVRISSIRDTEMFQIYLCLCALENNIAAVQEELFPLCVMLYPPLKVNWHLVRQLIRLLTDEIQRRLSPKSLAVFVPYLTAFQEMFAEDIFPNTDPLENSSAEPLRNPTSPSAQNAAASSRSA